MLHWWVQLRVAQQISPKRRHSCDTAMSLVWHCNVTSLTRQCHSCDTAVSLVWHCNVTRVTQQCHSCDMAMSLMWQCNVTLWHNNVTSLTRVMSLMWHSNVTHVTQQCCSCDIAMSLVKDRNEQKGSKARFLRSLVKKVWRQCAIFPGRNQHFHLVLQRCWLNARKGIHPTKKLISFIPKSFSPGASAGRKPWRNKAKKEQATGNPGSRKKWPLKRFNLVIFNCFPLRFCAVD